MAEARVLATCFIVCAICGPVSAQSLLTVDQNDSAIVSFRQQPARAAAPAIPSLNIPVLGIVPAAGSPAPAAAPPTVIADSSHDPNWYSLIYDRGDVKISITGDLRFQSTPLPAQPPSAPAEQINVASLDDPEDSVAAQITIFRFPNIPYVIDVVCKSPDTFELCHSEQQLRNLLSSIDLLSVPGQAPR
jgi:hypothetical protein